MNSYKNVFESWNKFLKEEEEQFNEVTEEELGDISNILHDLKPEDLSFGNIFGNKMRLVVPMKTKDKNLEFLKKILKESGYLPDFSTGLASYHVLNLPGGFNTAGDPVKPSSMILSFELAKTLGDEEWQKKHPESAARIKKKQVKIGKLLQKGSRLFDIAKKSQNEFQKIRPEDFGLNPRAGNVQRDKEKTADYRKASEEAMKISDKDLGKLTDTFQGFTSRAVADANLFQNLANWWNKKSTFYRENPEAAESGEIIGDYSIIYTRHPIDVLRMSDFDDIESCHSPGSRGGGASYYKCVVAESHGYGPVAYIVKNEDLKNMKAVYELQDATDQELLDAIEENDEELFLDRERGTGDVEPLSRLRIKKYTNPSLKISLAVPEATIYGKKFPNFVKNVIDWAKESQPNAIKTMDDSRDYATPGGNAYDKDGYLNLSTFERHGGTYQDTADSELFYAMFGGKTVGRVTIDSTTEDNLEITPNLIEQWQNDVTEIKEHWNARMQAIKIDHATVEDDGAGEAYIDIAAKLVLALDEADFVTSAFQDKTRKAIEHISEELIDYGFHWLTDRVDYTTINPRSADWAELARSAAESAESKVVIEIPIDIEQVHPDGSGFAYNPDNFTEICQNLDQLDDKADGVLEIAKGFLKRQGILKGGGLFQLASALTDESWDEWDYDVDDEWNPTDIGLETTTYVNFEDLIKQIPITFDRRNPQSQEVFIEFAGDPLALASQTHGGEDYSFKGWEVRSPEFDTEKMGGFMSLDAVKEYAQWNVALLILRPKRQMHKIPKGYESTRDYLVAMKELMRDAAGGKENEFMFPYTQMWVNGPDSDDEYKMMYRMELDEDTPDDASASALKIATETDDEDLLKKMFRKAFAKVAKISGASLQETRKYFNKFDIF